MRADMTPGEAMMRAYADILTRDNPGVRVIYVPASGTADEIANRGPWGITTAAQIVDAGKPEEGA